MIADSETVDTYGGNLILSYLQVRQEKPYDVRDIPDILEQWIVSDFRYRHWRAMRHCWLTESGALNAVNTALVNVLREGGKMHREKVIDKPQA